IDNGINLSNIAVQEKTQSVDNTIRIISVANETKFHGYEKIILGLHYYYQNNGNKNILFNFVGSYRKETIALIDKLKLRNHVIFHGRLTGQELDDVYNNSDLGLGAFGYRRNETTGSCLKTKEYFAKGLPFINGWKEP